MPGLREVRSYHWSQYSIDNSVNNIHKVFTISITVKFPEVPIQFSSVINQPIYDEYWGAEKTKNPMRIKIPLDFILKSFEAH